jgi:predicted anti-sigma-YlaC factor YlaD
VQALKDLSCQELVELVTDYFEGELAPDEGARFETHLVYCRGCWNYLEQMRRTLEVMGELREESLDPVARDGLLAAFRDWNRGQGPGT